MSLQADPRWIEHRDAFAALRDGEQGAQDRYRVAESPYMELLAEHCESGMMRRHMMAALLRHHSRDVVFTGFDATDDEQDWVRSQPVAEDGW